ncbi:hypothetical protein KA996_08185 [bacterium]|nr:hypothetical protein [bacterium]
MPEIDLNTILIIGGAILSVVILRVYFVPRWSIFYEKYTTSYKLAMQFIKENQELRENIGELFEVKSIPHGEFNQRILTYKFEIIGEKETGILTIKMAPKYEWYIYRVILEFNGKEFLIFKEDE